MAAAPRVRGRRGILLSELLVSLLLGVVVLLGLATLLVAALRWTERVAARAEALEIVRMVWVILDEEVRPGFPERDWRLASDGALELRAFRGLARVCGPEGSGWSVAYRGLRAPDPARDSVLVLGLDGGWRAHPLTDARTGGSLCATDPGEEARLLTWSEGDGAAPVLVRVFERGRYSLEEGAFRYRRGAGGRQPLTPERLDPESRFEAEGEGIRVRLRIRGWREGDAPVGFEWLVRPAEGSAR